MHLMIRGFARLSIVLGADGTVKLLWRVRDGQIFEPEVQEARYINGEWVAGAPGVAVVDRSDEPEVTGFG